MIDKKDFKAGVVEFIKKNNGDCSVSCQYINSLCGMSFANMRGVKTSWGKHELGLYIPKEITSTIPYAAITSFMMHSDSLEIALIGSRLVSIRAVQ